MEGLKADYYLDENDFLRIIQIYQTVIITEKNLKYIISQQDFDTAQDQKNNDDKEWYPSVNSYYPYAEDVDALERVNHLLTLNSGNSYNVEGKENVKYAYSHQEAQIQSLLSTPLSFIILGKPELGGEELGQKIASEWHSIYIEPQTLINDEIKSTSRAGKCIEFNLRSGRSIGIDIILRLLEKRIKSESAVYRGVVICGFPLIPNDLYVEDPATSMSVLFSAKSIIDETLQLAFTNVKANSLTKMTKSSLTPTYSTSFSHNTELLYSMIANEVLLDVGADVDISFLPDISTSCEDQVNFLFDCVKKPFLIIHLMCNTEDAINIRSSYR